MATPLLLGHRGARKYAPENTIAAFELALADGCDGFEFDVRITADRQVVICHDPKQHHMEIALSAYAKLREHDAKLCTLDETLAAFHETAFLNLELKVAGGEESVIAAVKQCPPTRGLIVSSFLPEVVERFGELDATFDLGLICENRRQLAKWKDLPIQALMLQSGLVNRKLMDEVRATTSPKSPRIFVWTVNDAREMKKFAEMGAEGIISDDTKLLVKTLRPDFVA